MLLIFLAGKFIYKKTEIVHEMYIAFMHIACLSKQISFTPQKNTINGRKNHFNLKKINYQEQITSLSNHAS